MTLDVSKLDADQLENARVIVRTGEGMGMDDQTIAAALATAMMESKLRNLPGGDADSVGLFQQRPSQGWGSKEDILDTEYASKRFYQAYTRTGGSSVLERIANTQKPAEQYRGLYADFFDSANQVFTSIAGRPAPSLTGASVEKSIAGTEPGYVAPNSQQSQAANTLPPDATPDQIDAFIRTNYPDVAPFLLNDEIRNLAYDAALHDLSPNEVAHRFQQTDYYKTHGPTSRQLDQLLATDPTAAGQLIDKAKNLVGDMFSQNGLQLDDDKLGAVAKQAIRNGWISTQGQIVDAGGMQNFLAFTLGKSGKPLAGSAGASSDVLRATAKSYGVTLSQSTLDDWSLKIMQGAENADSFKKYVTDMAKTMWDNSPDVVNAIDKGRTVDQFFDPYKQAIGDALQMVPDQIDLFSDPRWQEVTHHFDPTLNGGQGGTRTMTLGEATRFARSQPEYAQNPAYKDTSAQAANQLLAWTGAVR